MKKSEELFALAPQPQRPPINAALAMSVNKAEAAGRYIKGELLTVAIWDHAKKPLAIWYFCGNYWTGQLRRDPKATPSFMWPSRINELQRGYGRNNRPAIMTADENRLRDYFGEPEEKEILDVIERALTAHRDARLKARNDYQAAQTEQWFAKIPKLAPDELDRRARAACCDAVLLWFSNKKEQRILPGGVPEMVKVQTLHCDSCDGTYTVDGWELQHRKEAVCQCCGKRMTLYNTRYTAKRYYHQRTFLIGQKTGDGLWIRRYLICFDYEEGPLRVTAYERGRWLVNGAKVLHWKLNYYWDRGGFEHNWQMCQKGNFAGALVCPVGPYQAYEFAVWEPALENELMDLLQIRWVDKYIKDLNLWGYVKLWEAVTKYPMGESLIKTGWGEELYNWACHRDRNTSTAINIMSRTYYGVFGLNRQELKTVLAQTGKKRFDCVSEAVRWKGAGMAITESNLKSVRNIRIPRDIQKLCKRFGPVKTLKYLRHQTRKITGAYTGEISGQVASDWADYIEMAEAVGANLKIESVAFPLDLARRHEDMVRQRREAEGLKGAAAKKKSAEMAGEKMEAKFHVSEILKRIKSTYEYQSGAYAIVVPQTATDIMMDSEFLNHCVRRGERYFERISSRESYILFLRHADKSEIPWYTLEVEPGGTVRQKRSYNNEQYADLEKAKPFIAEWQQAVQSRMSAGEIKLADRARELRAQEFDELKKNGNLIRTGRLAGKLLVDELMADLMEAAKNAG